MFHHRETILFAGNPRFFVKGFRAAPRTEFFQLDLPFHLLLIFMRIVIPPLADGTAHRDQGVGPL